jgi:hypothetical protein
MVKMEFLIKAWTVGSPIIFIIFLIISALYIARFSQKQCNRLFNKIYVEIKDLFTNKNPFGNQVIEGVQSKIFYYTTFVLSSLLSIFIVCFIIGSFMLYAVSEVLSVIGVSILPSFLNIAFEWTMLIISAILLVFAGIYASKLLSYYIHKLNIPHAHQLAQVSSTILLILAVFISLRHMGSATSIFNLSFLIVSASLLIALVLPVVKLNHEKSDHKRKAA